MGDGIIIIGYLKNLSSHEQEGREIDNRNYDPNND